MFVLYSYRSGFYSPPSTTGRTTPIGSTSVKPHTAFFQPKEMVPNICYCVWLKVTAENNPPPPPSITNQWNLHSVDLVLLFFFFFAVQILADMKHLCVCCYFSLHDGTERSHYTLSEQYSLQLKPVKTFLCDRLRSTQFRDIIINININRNIIIIHWLNFWTNYRSVSFDGYYAMLC